MAEAVLDRNISVPLYQQLRQLLRSQIVAGMWDAGETLPTELQLCDMYGVSRTTARAAIDDLVREGLIHREQGRGTFVSHRPYTERFVQSLSGFHHDMTSRGYTVVSDVLGQNQCPADERVSQCLQIPMRIPVVRLVRLRLLNGEPVCHITAYVPYALCPDILSADFSNQSLNSYIEQTYGFRSARASRTVEARPMPADVAQALGSGEGSPALYIESIARLADGTPLEFYEAWHRGDKTKFEVDVVAEESE